jgi:hypothetical protein
MRTKVGTVTWHAPAVDAVNRARARYYLSTLSPEQVNRFLNGQLLLNANNAHWYDAAVNAVCTLLNSGKMQILSGAQPAADATLTGVLLATLTFGATAFGASSGGVATANAITAGTAGNTGTAGYHALLESNNTTVVATGTAGNTSGFDLNFNSTSISSGASVSCSAYTITGG